MVADDPQVQRLLWRSRRGMLELDLLLQPFVKQRYNCLEISEKAAFEVLLEYSDSVLLELLMGRAAAADPEVARVVEQIRATPAP